MEHAHDHASRRRTFFAVVLWWVWGNGPGPFSLRSHQMPLDSDFGSSLTPRYWSAPPQSYPEGKERSGHRTVMGVTGYYRIMGQLIKLIFLGTTRPIRAIYTLISNSIVALQEKLSLQHIYSLMPPIIPSPLVTPKILHEFYRNVKTELFYWGVKSHERNLFYWW